MDRTIHRYRHRKIYNFYDDIIFDNKLKWDFICCFSFLPERVKEAMVRSNRSPFIIMIHIYSILNYGD